MKSLAGCVVLCVALPLSTAACGGADEGTSVGPLEDAAPVAGETGALGPAESAQAADQVQASDQFIEGTLGKMDPGTMTFTLADDPVARTFTITDETEVTGTSSAQGLAGREGAEVTVHFREDAGEWVVTRILLE